MQALSVALKGFVKPVLDSLALPDHVQNPRQFLKTVTFLLSATTRCSTEMRALFPDTARAVMSSLTHPLFQPFERFVAKYAALDGAVLSEEVCLPVRKVPHPPVRGSLAQGIPEVMARACISEICPGQRWSVAAMLPVVALVQLALSAGELITRAH